MTIDPELLTNSRMQNAINELQAIIRERYPEATFDVGMGEDPDGVYLLAIVDVDDRSEVIEAFIDRLVDFQVEEELPIYVVPVRPPERNAVILAEQGARTAAVSAL